MNFEPRFADFEARARTSLSDQTFMSKLIGARALVIEPGYVEIAAPVRSDLLQPHGNVHGVVATALADAAAGYAAQTLVAEGYDIVTVENKINYLAPGIGTSIRACGKVLRPGRTLFVCAVDIYADEDDQSTLFAHMVATMMAVTGTGQAANSARI